MTAELLGSAAGVVLSLAFSYVPGLKAWYSGLIGEWKRLLMAGLLLLVAAVVYGLSCTGVLEIVVCGRDGLIGLVKVFVATLVANQSTYSLAGSQQRNWHVHPVER